MTGYFLEQTGNALSLGGIYALLALGLAVVYSILDHEWPGVRRNLDAMLATRREVKP